MAKSDKNEEKQAELKISPTLPFWSISDQELKEFLTEQCEEAKDVGLSDSYHDAVSLPELPFQGATDLYLQTLYPCKNSCQLSPKNSSLPPQRLSKMRETWTKLALPRARSECLQEAQRALRQVSTLFLCPLYFN